jgi:hypothetical protein
MVMVLVLFLFFILFFCRLLVSLPFICYLTNKDLGHRRFHFTSHGICFFFSLSCPLFIFYFVPSCLLLVSLPFICYLRNKDLVHRRFHFISHGTFKIKKLCSSYSFSEFLPFLFFLHMALGHRRFHYIGHGSSFFLLLFFPFIIFNHMTLL